MTVPSSPESSFVWPWRAAGITLAITAVLPLYLWLRDPRTGLAGAATVDMANDAGDMIRAGVLMAIAVGILCARILDPERVLHWIDTVRAAVLRIDGRAFAATAAAIAGLAAILVQNIIFHREAVLIDAMTQLAHARYIAAGLTAAPADSIGFFQMLQTVPVTGGWISQYPPMQPWLLALAYRVGAVWLLGPVALAAAVFFTARAMDSMLPGRAAPRIGILAAAVSPFMLAHAATYMSHTTAAAFIALALYAMTRSTRATTAAAAGTWCAACGVGIGATFATRPLTGVVAGVVLLAAMMLRATTSLGARARAVACTAAGALPLLIAVALYNAHYFGAPTRFGYDIALGPDAGLGFGTDPWGNLYGVRQAIAYTSAELIALSLQLFESPLPLVALTGVNLALAQTLAFDERVLFALVLVPLLANLLYWHHGLFMGPRMLNEYGVLWAILIMTGLASLLRRVPARLGGALAAWSPRSFAIGVYATGVAFSLFLGPQRLSSHTTPSSRALTAAAAAGPGAVVFVHSGWSDRVSMQLVARGWRLDRVETAMRQNSTCTLQRVLDGDVADDQLDMIPRATGLPARVESPAGNAFRVSEGEPWPFSCAVQVAADTTGAIDPAPLLWRGSLPGIRGSQPVFARDLGPALNARLAANGADARVLMRGPDGAPVLVPYDSGMRRLWGALAR